MYDGTECPDDYGISENSENIDYSPTVLSWLPKNLLNSPTVEKYPAAITDRLVNGELTEPTCTPSQALITGSNLRKRGMKLTTQSGAHIVILDPYIAEQLVLNPIRAQLIACARSWTREPQDQLGLSELIQARNSLSSVYEEYLDVFGQLPGPISRGKSYYLDYAFNGVDNDVEKQNLLETMQLAQRCMTELLDQEVNGTPIIRNSTNPLVCVLEPPDDSTIPNYPPTNENTTLGERVADNLDGKVKRKKRPPLQPVTPINSIKPPKSNRPMKTEDMLFNVRYKTQPCRHYEQSGGFCLAGDDCHFAHGTAELRDPQNHPKFRTRVCRNFAENGSCNFGARCFFKHVKEQKSTDNGKQVVTVEVHQSAINDNNLD